MINWNLLNVLSILAAALAGILAAGGDTRDEMRDAEGRRRMRLNVRGWLSIVVITIGATCSIISSIMNDQEKLAAEQRRTEEARLAREWRNLTSGQDLDQFELVFFFKEAVPVEGLESFFHLVGLSADSPNEQFTGFLLPRTAVMNFSWKEAPSEVWTADFEVGAALNISPELLYNVVGIKPSAAIERNSSIDTRMSFLVVDPVGVDKATVKLRLPQEKSAMTYGIVPESQLIEGQDKIGGVQGRAGWRDMGLYEYVPTLDRLPNLTTATIILSKEFKEKYLQAMAFSFSTKNSTLTVFVDDLKYDEVVYDILVAHIKGSDLYNKLEEQFRRSGGQNAYTYMLPDQ